MKAAGPRNRDSRRVQTFDEKPEALGIRNASRFCSQESVRRTGGGSDCFLMRDTIFGLLAGWLVVRPGKFLGFQADSAYFMDKQKEIVR